MRHPFSTETFLAKRPRAPVSPGQSSTPSYTNKEKRSSNIDCSNTVQTKWTRVYSAHIWECAAIWVDKQRALNFKEIAVVYHTCSSRHWSHGWLPFTPTSCIRNIRDAAVRHSQLNIVLLVFIYPELSMHGKFPLKITGSTLCCDADCLEYIYICVYIHIHIYIYIHICTQYYIFNDFYSLHPCYIVSSFMRNVLCM